MSSCFQAERCSTPPATREASKNERSASFSGEGNAGNLPRNSTQEQNRPPAIAHADPSRWRLLQKPDPVPVTYGYEPDARASDLLTSLASASGLYCNSVRFAGGVSTGANAHRLIRVSRTLLITVLLLVVPSTAQAQDEKPNREAEIEAYEAKLDASLEKTEEKKKTGEEPEEETTEEIVDEFERDTEMEMNFFAVEAPNKPRKKGEPLEFLKPAVNFEISFIKRVCEPSDEQMKAIIEAATRSYQGTGNLVQEEGNRLFDNNGFRVMGPNNEQLNEHPLRRIRSDALEYLPPIVSKDQFAIYKIEADLRDEFERSAAIEMIIGMVDEKLALTDEQRVKLNEGLMKEWKDVDLQSIQTYLYNPEYVPQLPAGTINKVFTKKQLEAWKSFNQTNFGVQFNQGQDGMGIEGEDWIK